MWTTPSARMRLRGPCQASRRTSWKPCLWERFDRTKPDFTALAPRVAQKQPQAAVVFVGTGAAVVDGIKALRGAGVTAQIVTLSNNASGGFIKALGDSARGVG